MLVVTLALLLVAVTAAVVIRDVQSPAPKHALRHEPKTAEAPEPEPIEMPTQAVDMTGLLRESDDRPTADIELPVLEAAGATLAPGLLPAPPGALPATESDHLIQTEVLQPYGQGEQARALSKLLLGIAGSGLAIGLVVIALVRGVEALVHAIAG